MDITNDIIGISCAILKDEINGLIAQGKIHIPFDYVDSMLHMHPSKLNGCLNKIIDHHLSRDRRIVLVYGDCCPHMNKITENPNVTRTAGINCCEILLGKKVYRQHVKEGAFFLMPEWALRWKEIFSHELGFSQEVALDMMNELHKSGIYLNTGCCPIPQTELDTFSDYCNLPVEVMHVSLDLLLDTINTTIAEIHT
jgi:hypothetical protein